MSDLSPDFSPLTNEQFDALTNSQKEIFLKLDDPDRQFFAKNFSSASLGNALERKWEAIGARARFAEHDRRIKENLAASAGAPAGQPSISVSDIAAGAAGVAGLVGVGVLARQIAPEGKATWRGVAPRDLVDPLVKAFARQEKTEIRFDPPTPEGNLHADVLLRTNAGMTPGLAITLTPLQDSTQVQISKLASASVMESFKDNSQGLLNLVKDGVNLSKTRSSVEGFLDMAGKVITQGTNLARSVNDMDLEDKAWEAIQRTADPLQVIYDERKAAERENRLKLEMNWDDFYSCPTCRVQFGAGDQECRVCGSARPPQPDQPDPRTV